MTVKATTGGVVSAAAQIFSDVSPRIYWELALQ
jgi:hypothetical protein